VGGRSGKYHEQLMPEIERRVDTDSEFASHDPHFSEHCCVSTIEGVMRIHRLPMGGLVLADGVAEMADAIIALAMAQERRNALALYRHLIDRP
jgi:hypothetical protein